MTGVDMLLASLTQEQLEERAMDDVRATMADLSQWAAEIEAAMMRLIIEDLEKRTRE